jgi:hypothetical protein
LQCLHLAPMEYRTSHLTGTLLRSLGLECLRRGGRCLSKSWWKDNSTWRRTPAETGTWKQGSCGAERCEFAQNTVRGSTQPMRKRHVPGTVVHCRPSTWEVQGGGWRVQGRVGYTVGLWLKKKKKKSQQCHGRRRLDAGTECTSRRVVVWPRLTELGLYTVLARLLDLMETQAFGSIKN